MKRLMVEYATGLVAVLSLMALLESCAILPKLSEDLEAEVEIDLRVTNKDANLGEPVDG